MSWKRLRSWLNVSAKPTRSKPKKTQRLATIGLEPLELRLAPAFTVGPNINISKSLADDAETAIVVNPTNPLNLFATSTAGAASGGANSGHYYSVNGGLTWLPSSLSTIYGGFSGGDEQMAWDHYGNLFMTYFAIDFLGAIDTVVALSIDGGKSFQISLDTRDFQDQPAIAVGAGTVWYMQNGGAGPHVIRHARVSGLGQVGPWSTEDAMPGVTAFFGDIAVGPNGQAFVVGQTGDGEDPGFIFGALDPDGPGPIPFGGGIIGGGQIIIAPVNVGTFDEIPAQPNRTIDAEANLAWDKSFGNFNGRLYLVYTDETADETSDTDIYVSFSDDNGITWSARKRVNDDTPFNGRSQFMPGIAVDQTTGNVGVAWYDCRNHPGNTRPEVWMSVSTDGGVTWEPNKQLSTPLTGQSRTPPGGFDFGDYNKADFHAGKFYYSWGDNSNSTGNNPAGFFGATDIYTAIVTVTGGGGSGGGSGGLDPTEPNDRSDMAYRLGRLTSTITVANVQIKNKPQLDQDWYHFRPATTSGTVTITMRIVSPVADLDMRLWTIDGLGTLKQLAASTAKRGGGTEQIVFNYTNQKFPFLLQVYGFQGAQSIYDVTLTPGSGSTGGGGGTGGNDRFEANDNSATSTVLGRLAASRTESGLSIFNKPGADNDWFRFRISKPGTMEIFVDNTGSGDIDLRLYKLNASGGLTLVGSSFNRGNGLSESITLSGATTTDLYFIQVFGFSGSQSAYDLRVVHP